MLDGAVWLPEYLAWLGASSLEAEDGATVWFGGHDLVPYASLWHDIRDFIATRVLRTNYQENRGYPLRTAIDLLGGTLILGAKQLAELHGARIRPASKPPGEPPEPGPCPE